MAYQKMQSRTEFRNVWQTEMMSTITEDCPFCCFSCFCASCSSYILRKRAIYNDMTRYECCAGYMPCSGRCMESECPEFCLCSEVFCCLATSVASTRFLLQDEFNIQNTQCDNCLIAFMIIVDQLACVFSLIACILGSDELNELAHVLRCISELTYCTVCACMQTQHKIEMDKRDGMFGGEVVVEVPPVQIMSRVEQPLPPTVGYPPPPPATYPPPTTNGPPYYPAHPHYAYPPPPPPPHDPYAPPPSYSK